MPLFYHARGRPVSASAPGNVNYAGCVIKFAGPCPRPASWSLSKLDLSERTSTALTSHFSSRVALRELLYMRICRCDERTLNFVSLWIILFEFERWSAFYFYISLSFGHSFLIQWWCKIWRKPTLSTNDKHCALAGELLASLPDDPIARWARARAPRSHRWLVSLIGTINIGLTRMKSGRSDRE